jgi:CubicO group peptidase (beta-lactamase class C family)
MSAMSRFVRVLIGSGVVLGILCLIIYLPDPLFWKRLLTFPGSGSVTEVEWYQPSEAVAGSEREDLTLSDADHSSVSREALDVAVEYGAQTRSAALLVWHRGSLQLEHYWPGYDRQSRTESGAMHATVLALAYGAAIEEGVIRSLDEPAATYLPEWRSDEHAKIRIRDLLQMSSGLEYQALSRNPWNRGLRLFLGSDITALALGVPMSVEPGTRFEYNNLDAQILGIILQRASGKRYARYLSERIWNRLGVGDATVWLDRENGMARTFCCLQTTARGWLAVGLSILDLGRVGDEQIVPAAWVLEMLKASGTNPSFGLQIWLGDAPGGERGEHDASRARALQSEPFVARDVVFVGGAGGQRVYVVPSQQLIIVRTGTRRADWDDAKLPNAILRGVS